MTKQTIKLIFMDFHKVNVDMLLANIKGLPIYLVQQDNRIDPFLMDTGIMMEKKK